MNEIITDIKALQEETLLNLQNSKANNTVRAYKSDFNDFGLFCAQNGFKSLPSEPKTVSLYLTYLSTKEVKISTLKRRLVSIGVNPNDRVLVKEMLFPRCEILAYGIWTLGASLVISSDGDLKRASMKTTRNEYLEKMSLSGLLF